jgi:hypothetical protein
VDDFLLPWRAEAERRGFRLVERRGDVLHLLSGATFLDLRAAAGRIDGATLKTWIEAGADRWALITFGVALPRPRPGGAAGWLAAQVVALMQGMVPETSRPVPMRAPEDLGAAIDKHVGELLAVAGKPVQFAGDPLQARFEQERHDP